MIEEAVLDKSPQGCRSLIKKWLFFILIMLKIGHVFISMLGYGSTIVAGMSFILVLYLFEACVCEVLRRMSIRFDKFFVEIKA